jgi:hypothetical protein
MNLFHKFLCHLIDRIQNVLKFQTFVNKLFKSNFDLFENIIISLTANSYELKTIPMFLDMY